MNRKIAIFVLVCLTLIIAIRCVQNHDIPNNEGTVADFSKDYSDEQIELILYRVILDTGTNRTEEDYAYNIQVVLNRLNSPEFPNTVEELCGDVSVVDIPENAIKGLDLVETFGYDNTNGDIHYK